MTITMTQEPIVINITINAPVADPDVEARLRQYIAETAVQTKRQTIEAIQRLRSNSPGRY